MEHTAAKIGVLGVLGVVGAYISKLFGGWDSALNTLVIFMGVDFFTGLIVAGVFKKSRKSESGGLASKAGWTGLFKKVTTLFMVLIAAQLDITIGTNFIRDSVVIGYIINEALSLIENAGLMGVPIPDVLVRAIDILKKQSDDKSKKDEGGEK